MTKKFNRGFTLIEILVVISIIGMLSSIVLSSLSSAKGKSSNAAIKTSIDSVRASAEMYYDDPLGGNGSYLGLCTSVVSSAIPFQKGVSAADSASGSGGGVKWSAITGQVPPGSTGTTNCHSGSSASWVVSVPLKTPETINGTTYNYWCADSTGTANYRVTLLSSNAPTCPAS